MATTPYPGLLSREARRKKKLTQTDLAKELHCHISAISAFENGSITALSRGKLVRLGEILGVDMEAALDAFDIAIATRLRYCTSSHCPSAKAVLIHEQIVLFPSFFEVESHRDRYCRLCGEVLARACPQCGSELRANAAYCPECGGAYLPPLLDGMSENRRRLQELVASREREQAKLP